MTDTPNMRRDCPTDPPGRLRAWLARRRRDDRGATLVEAAFVTPVFVLMLFGIFEFSGYVAAVTGANAAIKAGARMATVQGNAPMADREILRRMSVEGSGLVASNDVIEEIKIWHASALDEAPPTSCNAASQCNDYLNPNQSGGAYSRANLPLMDDSTPTAALDPNVAECFFGYDTGMSTVDCPDSARYDKGWPPKTRRILEKAPDHVGACVGRQCDTTDLVGIWIKVRHDYYTGFFGQSVTVTSKTIAKIEPQGYDR